MGNYYEGSFRVKLRTWPEELGKIMLAINKKTNDINHPFFKTNQDVYLECGTLIGHYNDKLEDDYLMEYSFEDWENEKYAPDMVDYSLKGYYISAHVNRKNYKDELSLLLDLLKDFIPADLNPLVVGKVQDEDGHCDKDLYFDRDAFDKMKKEREFLCKSCDRDSEHKLCPHFAYCRRAYSLPNIQFNR